MTHLLLGDDLSSQITAMTGLVSAVGVIVLGWLSFLQHRKLTDVKATADNTAVAVTMKNGHTLGETVEGISDAIPEAEPVPIFTNTGETPVVPSN